MDLTWDFPSENLLSILHNTEFWGPLYYLENQFYSEKYPNTYL